MRANGIKNQECIYKSLINEMCALKCLNNYNLNSLNATNKLEL